MNWYKIAKSQYSFSFSSEYEDIWKSILKKEQEAINLSFDLENNDNVGDVKRISLETKKNGWLDMKDGDFANLAVIAQLYYAGGDWQSPTAYFRCQIKEHGRYGSKFVFIPDQKEGNINLENNQPRDSDSYQELKERPLWDALKKHVEKRANAFYNDKDENSDRDYAKELRMYDWSSSLSLIRG